MISGLFLVNLKGEIVICRYYRDDVSRTAVDAWCSTVVAAKEGGTRPPVTMIEDGTTSGPTFIHTRHANMYFMACTRHNLNPSLVLQYLFQLVAILKAYFSKDFDEDAVRHNFSLVYELLDETLDFGYPQNCAIDVLKKYINEGKAASTEVETAPGTLTSQITGTIDWRREGLRYRKNEVFIDVLESVNLLMSQSGSVLRNDVSGSVSGETERDREGQLPRPHVFTLLAPRHSSLSLVRIAPQVTATSLRRPSSRAGAISGACTCTMGRGRWCLPSTPPARQNSWPRRGMSSRGCSNPLYLGFRRCWAWQAGRVCMI